MPAVVLSTTAQTVCQSDSRRTSLTLTNTGTDLVYWGFSSAEVIHEIYPKEHFTMTFSDGFEPRNAITAKSDAGTPTLLVDSGYLNEDLLRNPWERIH